MMGPRYPPWADTRGPGGYPRWGYAAFFLCRDVIVSRYLILAASYGVFSRFFLPGVSAMFPMLKDKNILLGVTGSIAG